MSSHFVYILKCADDTYYVGMTMNIERRLSEHQSGHSVGSYTFSRRPVVFEWSAEFPTRREAFAFEQQIKGWGRAKKEALIRGDWDGLHTIVKTERKIQDAQKRKGSSSPK